MDAAIPLITTLVGLSFTAVVSLMVWMVQTLHRTNVLLGRMEERSEDHERRISQLEQQL